MNPTIEAFLKNRIEKRMTKNKTDKTSRIYTRSIFFDVKLDQDVEVDFGVRDIFSGIKQGIDQANSMLNQLNY